MFEVEFQGWNINLDRDQFSYLQVGSSILVIFLLLSIAEYSVQVFKRHEWERNHPTLENFTVEVTNILPKIKYKDIECHFENFVNKRVVNATTASKRHRCRQQGDDQDVEGGFHNVQYITTIKARLTFATKLSDMARIAEQKVSKSLWLNENFNRRKCE